MVDYKSDKSYIKDKQRDIAALQRFPVLGGNNALIYIYKKAERISVALHMATNHIKDNEPVKTEVRDVAVDIVRNVSKLTRSGPTDRRDTIASLTESVLRALGSLESMVGIRLLSVSSAGLLKRELALLLQLADTQKEHFSDSENIDPNLFYVPAVAGSDHAPASPVAHARPAERAEASALAPATGEVLAGMRSNEQARIKDISVQKTDNKKSIGQEDRRSSIINLLKAKGDLSVKDFTKVVPGVSEKTIQRELIAMNSEGILKRTGKRRWTRYALVG